MNDGRLRSAASVSIGDFGTEWIAQGGPNDGATISSMYSVYRSPVQTTGGGATAASNASSSSSSKYSSSIGGSSDGILTKLLKAGGSTPEGASGTWVGLDDISRAVTLQNIFNAFRHPLDFVDNIMTHIGDNIAEYYERQRELYETINQQTGMMNEMAAGFRQEITNSIPRASQLGISFKEMASSVTDMTVESGRFKLIDQSTIEKVMLASKFVGTMNETMKMMPNFQEVSMGVSDATEAIDKSGMSSLRLGLNARETVKTLSASLDKMNQFGFKNGIDGLNRMVQKAQELRMNMDTVLGIADKVMDPEKALEMSANLQVIGGALGDFNDPIRMMYMSTNDVEGLNDALAKSAESLVTFNQEQGRFQIFGGDLRRGKAMAEQMGISYKELSNIAIQSAQRTQAANDIMMSGINLDESDREFITNMSQMKEGKMVIEIPQNLRDQFKLTGEETSIALDSFSEKQVSILKAQKDQFEKMGMEELAQKQFSLISNINNNLNAIKDQILVKAGALVSETGDRIGVTTGQIDSIKKDIFSVTGDINTGVETIKNKWQGYINQYTPNLTPPSIGVPPPTNVSPLGLPPTQPMGPPPSSTIGTPPPLVQNSKIDVNLKIQSGSALFDGMSRYLVDLPDFKKEVKNSFLEKFEPNIA